MHLLIAGAALAAVAVVACAQVGVSPQSASRVWNYPAVHAAAAEIQEAVEHARHVATQRALTTDPAQVRAVADLVALADAAGRFNQRVEPSHQESEYTRGEYEAVVRAYRTANQSARLVQLGRSVGNDLDRAGALIERLAPMYGPRWQYEQVAAIAGELEQSTAQIYRKAQESAHAGAASDQRTLFLLSQLAFAAAHYRRQIELERDPSVNFGVFRTVLENYARCSSALPAAGFDAQVQPEFVVIGRVLDELARAYLIPWDFPAASSLADRLRSAAQRLNDGVASKSHAGRPEEIRAVQDLALLTRATDRLVRQLVQAPDNPGASYPEFLLAAAGYERAAASFPQVQLGSEPARDFAQMGLEISQLRRMYASQRELSLTPAQISGVPVGR